MATPTYSATGNKAATAASLDKNVFGQLPENFQLLKEAYLAYLANGRTNNAVTKTRGLISGGGRKPWRQKGTGRARFGSSRNPIWRGGGIVFGPTGLENYRHNLPLKAKRQALRQALSLASHENRIKVIETFECKEGKVATTAKLLKKIGATGNVLLVIEQKDILVERATRNVANLKVVQASYLNVFDILNADQMVISKKSLDILDNWLGQTKPAPTKEEAKS